MEWESDSDPEPMELESEPMELESEPMEDLEVVSEPEDDPEEELRELHLLNPSSLSLACSLARSIGIPATAAMEDRYFASMGIQGIASRRCLVYLMGIEVHSLLSWPT
ncbi:hypothetical protein NL676_034836 [Syzygium grande]|nr:hypothetical protein NL676_034836 [Syzygium grande]